MTYIFKIQFTEWNTYSNSENYINKRNVFYSLIMAAKLTIDRIVECHKNYM